MPTPIFVCGAECGIATVGTLGVGTEHWSSVLNPPSVVTSGPASMRSTRCYRFNPTGTANVMQHTFAAAVASPATCVARFYIYFTTLPDVDTLLFQSQRTSASVKYVSSDTTLRAFSGTTTAAAGAVVTTGQWYRVDVKWVVNTTQTCDIQVDGVAQTQASEAGAAATETGIGVGNAQSVTADYYIDDIIVSGTSGDYPIGAGTVVGLYPNGDGTHVYSANTDFSKDGATGTACAFPVATETTSWQSLTKPLSTTIDTTKFVTDLAGAATEWLEWTLDDLPAVSSVNGFMAATTNHASTATANNIGMKLVDGATTTNVYPADVNDFSEITIVTAVKTFATAPSTGTAWTKTLVDAAKIRWGMSTDVAPDPILDGVCLEVDYVAATVASNSIPYQSRSRRALRSLIVR